MPVGSLANVAELENHDDGSMHLADSDSELPVVVFSDDDIDYMYEEEV